jgi:hypothetical protein
MTLFDLVKDFLEGLKTDLAANYNRLGLKASGNWERELETQVEQTTSGIHGKILGADYTWYLEHGRKPNINQGQDALRAWVGWAGSTFLKEWVERRGIAASPFAIAWKIAREGVKVPNRFNTGGLVSDVVTEARINEFAGNFSRWLVEDLRSDILKTFK